MGGHRHRRSNGWSTSSVIPLERLIEGLDGQPAPAGADPNVEVPDLFDDSRQVTPGSLFIARTGAQTTGEAYIREAIERGAASVLAGRPPQPGESGTAIWVTVPELDTPKTALIAARFFGYPSHKLHVLGVTGTNGKTTVAWLIRQILEACNIRCGLLGTVCNDLGAGPQKAGLTTPGAIDLQRMLYRMVQNGCQAAACEFSSHGLDQGRTAHLLVQTAVFTNLSGDHLDYHGTMEAYAQAKAKLFAALPRQALAVINADDAYAEAMSRPCPARKLFSTIRDRPDCQLSVREIELMTSGFRARLVGPWGSVPIQSSLLGEHNVCNLLQALGAAGGLVDLTGRLQAVIDRLRPAPGRLERITPAWKPAEAGSEHSNLSPSGQAPTGSTEPEADEPSTGADDGLPAVLVDYAHTDDALANVLGSLRQIRSESSRIWVVFGCGGDRDRTKRPRMAEVACRLADRIIITSDNPRTESPEAIIQGILSGVGEGVARLDTTTVDVVDADAAAGRAVWTIADRAEAIGFAVGRAAGSDVVLIAGKGHEQEQIIGDQRLSFDDRVHAAAAMRARLHAT